MALNLLLWGKQKRKRVLTQLRIKRPETGRLGKSGRKKSTHNKESRQSAAACPHLSRGSDQTQTELPEPSKAASVL